MTVIKSGAIPLRLSIPSSKSYSNRLLILASACEQEVRIENLSDSSDVQTLKDCLQQIGILFDGLRILNSFPACEKEDPSVIELDTGDGGTTNRFLLALLCRGRNRYRLYPSNNFLNRPFGEYFKILDSLGAKIIRKDQYIEIQGPMTSPGGMIFQQLESSQFLSALKLAFWQDEISYQNVNKSQKYLKLTDYLVEQFRKGERNFSVPCDFSALAYPVVFALVAGQKLVVENCIHLDHLQADSKLFQLLEQMGIDFSFECDGLKISENQEVMPFDVDGCQCPDLIPALSFLASYCPGKSRLSNLKILKGKESNRLQEIEKLLGLYQVKFERAQDDLIIWGADKKVGFKKYVAPADHRMIMTAALFMRKNSGGEIDNSIHVKKSFPDFFSIMD